MKKRMSVIQNSGRGKTSPARGPAIAKIVPPGTTQPPDANVAISLIDTKPQVRTKFRNVEELAASIRLNGIIEPLVLHAEEGGRYRLIVGERRLRAAPLAGLTEVPVVIKRGLNEFQIRSLQVAENNDRDNLTAYEQAMGVIEDVEKFGTHEAMNIWNVKSEGWISKRIAVGRYGPRTLELLESGSSNDFEALHCLNQIEQLDAKEFGHVRKRLDAGLPISRDEARNTLARVKAWKKQQEELAQRRREADAVREKATNGEIEKSSQGGKKSETSAAVTPAKAAASTSKGKSTARSEAVALEPTTAELTLAERNSLLSQLNRLRDELFDAGVNNQGRVASAMRKMNNLDYELNQGEWVLWAGFLDTILPMLHALGHERSVQYLKRLQVEMKVNPALAIWKDLHPAVTNRNTEDEETPRQKVVDMPEGWRF